MRTFTFVVVAIMSMWIATEANAQKPAEQSQEAQGDVQIDGKKDRQGRRGRRNRGLDQQGEGQGNGKRQGQGRGGQQILDTLFTRFDADKNGSISLAEAPERMKQRFEKLDANSDKSISKEELQASFANMQGGRKGQGKNGAKGKDGGNGKGKKGEGRKDRGQQLDPTKMIQDADANNDGSISLDEAPERMKKNFDRIDVDSSGTITADELKVAFENMKKRGGKGKGKDGSIGRNKSANPDDKLPKQPKRPPMAEEGA